MKSIDVLAHQLTVAPSFGARYVNVHTGSHKGQGLDDGIGRVAEGIAAALAQAAGTPQPALLVLENSAGGGGGIGVDIGELSRLIDQLAVNGVGSQQVAICLDTAHLWGAGYPIDTVEGVDRVVGEFSDRIGLARLVDDPPQRLQVGAGVPPRPARAPRSSGSEGSCLTIDYPCISISYRGGNAVEMHC